MKVLLVMKICHVESPAHDGLPAWIMIRYLQRGIRGQDYGPYLFLRILISDSVKIYYPVQAFLNADFPANLAAFPVHPRSQSAC